MNSRPDKASLPGEDLVEKGLADLAADRTTDCSLLVLIAAPRLRLLGIEVLVRRFDRPVEHLLYERLEDRLGTDAHSHYNSLIRRIVSYEHALEREQSAREDSGAFTAAEADKSAGEPTG